MTAPSQERAGLGDDRSVVGHGWGRAAATIAARIAIVVLTLAGVHSLERFAPWYFIVAAAGLGVLVLSHFATLPGLGFLAELSANTRLSLCILVIGCGVTGYLHNLNEWVPHGRGFRPLHVALWKSELILLGISLGAPLLHWLVGRLLPWISAPRGRRFATEFALYVNFSGLALLLWTGEAAISATMLGAVIVLVALTELTLYASD